MIKGIIFDFNGTLFFDTEKHEKAWGKYAEQILGRSLTKEENNSIMGRNNRLILEFLLGRTPSAEEERTMGGEKEEMYRKMCREESGGCRLADGAEDFLDRLAENNIPIAIATSSDVGNVNFYFEMFGIDRWFSRERVIFDDGTIDGKPAPDIYLKAAGRLNLSPKECAVYEDAVSGIAAARNAKIGKIIAVASANKPEILAAEKGVDRVITDYTREWDKVSIDFLKVM